MLGAFNNFPFWPMEPICRINSITGIIGLAGIIFTLIMLIDCLKRKPSQFTYPLSKDGEYDKLIWALGILFSLSFYFIGSIVYFFIVKKAKPESKG